MARILAIFALVALFHVTMSITVEEFFKNANIKSNLTIIKWAHAVNTKQALADALKANIHMIEGDVSFGNVTNGPVDVPIMSHDNSDKASSDLSLEMFLKEAIQNKTKGVKLDFKSEKAYIQGLEVLKNTKNYTHIPIWLNADILVGPASGKAANVSASKFFEEAKNFNESLLSIGWTTSLPVVNTGDNSTRQNYTKQQLDEMKNVISQLKVNQSVTYPVRAAYAANSIEGLKDLLTNTSKNQATLTIWSNPEDNNKVNVTNLNKLIKTIGLSKIYIDVTPELHAKLDLNGAFGLKSSLLVLMTSLLSAIFAAKLL